MIWSEVDFEREVRRQLIELRSLRKRVPAEGELLQRIERLEASHHGILRKLSEFFRTQEQLASSAREESGKDLPVPAGTPATSVSASTLALSSARTRDELPSLTEVCACCGKLLISSLLAGGEIQRDSGAWFHVNCLEREKPIARRDTLN